ncbi:RNase adapter RapZ [Levilactobacillus bambusae]|uniref:RNase adapter RapZ n=1 Tax=Levilactobacillus bambusae TaxID=2024736 RepID=A0A2V1MZC4_9LACO|nr:RNase adapter RapZ [Levilactobacillus bambusae]PWF99439.1 RNase adapter RapZ [Levilactobacillus bambusae]
MSDKIELIIISGMSGAGKTIAMQSLEDLGYFCVDNLPLTLLPKFFDLLSESGKVKKVALVIDMRSRAFDQDLISPETDALISATHAKTVFLDASDEALVSRYKETRRRHPLSTEGRLVDGIRKERQLLEPLRQRAQLVIDTSNITPRQLREDMFHKFETQTEQVFHIDVLSFGFKYGLPIDADIVMDVRFLPNPYYIPELKELTGLDTPVYDYVMKQAQTEDFYQRLLEMLVSVMPGYKAEGKTSLTIAIGCTGGQHRSVSIARRLANDLGNAYPVNLSHRDVNRRKEGVNRS